MAYSIADFAESLDLDDCKIQNRPDLIFLCGGPIAGNGAFRSARDFYYRYLLKNKTALAKRIKLAEVISAWFQKDKAFPDLLQLENYLAHLAAATVLFVESPGSIAELGAFAASDALRPKTLAVLSNTYGSRPSFITDGPVRSIRTENDKHVHYFDWNPEELNSDAAKRELTDIAQALSESLEEEDAARERQLSFKKDQIGHTLLIVADLIRFVGVMSISDLLVCLKALGYEFTRQELDQHLSILESVEIIEERLRSNQIFYVSKSSRVFIRYGYRDGVKSSDTDRNQALVRDSLDSVRKTLLRRVIEKGASNV